MKKITTQLLILCLITLFGQKSFAQAPANDACGGAVTVPTDGTCVAGTTVASTDSWSGQVGCQTGGGNHLDVWYTFVATGTNYTGTVTASAPWAGDVEFILVSSPTGCTGPFTIVGSTCGASPLSINITGLTNGATYYFTVSRDAGGTAGPFSVCSTTSSPPVNCTDNDDCAAPTVITYTTGTQTCLTDCNTGANPGPDFSGNNCQDFPEETVWYSVTTGASSATIDIDLTSASLTNPYFSVFTTANCIAYTTINCTQGSAGSASASVSVATNTTYLIAISDQNGATGNFDLCVTVNNDNSACNTNDALTISSTSMGSPLNGPYQPGEVVSFCYTITNFQQVNCNYLQGIVPTFGDCWDPASFNAQGAPVNITTPLLAAGVIQPCPAGPPCTYGSCSGTASGAWSWFTAGAVTYNNITGSLPPNSPMPAGWYFLSSYDPITGACTGADPTDPDNSYGDGNYPACGVNTLDYQLCFNLTARGSAGCTGGQTNCSVSMKTYADGEIGFWNNPGCTADNGSTNNTTLCCTSAPTVTTPVTYCQNAGASALTATGTNLLWYTAATGGVGTAVAPTPSTSTVGSTNYYVSQTTGGCESPRALITVTVNAGPTVSVSGTNTICNGGNTSLTASGASTYTWTPSGSLSSPNGAIVTATPTTSTVYTVTGTAANTCTATATYSVTVNTPPTLSVSGTNTICNGGNTSLTASGASTYTWTPSGSLSSPNGAIVTATPTTSTVYTVTGTAANTCTATATYSVTVNTPPTLSVSGTNTICNGGNTSLTASGASTYTWTPSGSLSSPNGAIVTATPTTSTVYTVTGTAANTCTATATYSVTVNTPPTLSVSGTNTICNGGNTSLTASGASTYTWTPSGSLSSPNGAIVTATPTTSTVYTVTGTAVNTCTATTTYSVTVNTPPTLSVSGTNTICNGGNTSLTASGASSYTWTPSGSLSSPNGAIVTATPTTSTVYTVTGTAANTCTATATYSVTVNTPPTLSVSGTNTICNGGNTSLTASGASTYTWTPSGSLSSANGATVTATPTTSTVYTVTGTAANTCTATATYSVTVNTPPTLSVSGTNTICNGGNTSLTASGASTYTWTPSGSLSSPNGAIVTATPTTSTVYTVTGTAANTCTATATYSVTVNTPPTLSVSGTNTICNGGNTSLTASGASTYTWTPSGSLSSANGAIVTATPTTSTVYTVTGTAVNTCTATATYSVTVNDNPTAIDVTTTPATCGNPDGSVTINSTTGGTSPYQYNFNGGGLSGTTSYNSLLAGSYSLLVSDVNLCTFSTFVNINNSGAPTAVQTTLVADSCGRNTGQITIGAITGGSGSGETFSVDGSAFTTTLNYTGLTSGIHSVEVKDGLGCSFSTTVDIPALVGPTGFSTTITDETCSLSNGDITVSSVNGGTPAYEYNINGGTFGASANFTGLAAGTYTINVMDLNTCVFTNQVSIVNNAGPTAVASTTIDASCGASNGEISLGAVTGGTNPYTYNINGGAFGSTNNFTGLIAGTYTIVVQDNNTCTYTTQITINNSGGPSDITSTIVNATCGLANGSITSDNVTGGVGPYQYSIDNITFFSSNVFTNMAAGSYTIYVQDVNLCGYSEPFSITQTAGPTDIDSLVVNSTCGSSNGSVEITAVNGGILTYQYNFNNLGLSSTTIYSALAAGTYPLEIVDGNNCSYITSVVIGGSPAITGITNTTTNEACGQANGSITITSVNGGTGTYQYSINGGVLGTSANFTGLAVGSYTIAVEDASGCTYSEAISVVGTGGPSAVISTIVDAGCSISTGSITIDNVTGGAPTYSYGINGGAAGASNTFTALAAGLYTIEVVDANLCSFTTTLTVNTVQGPTAATTSQVNTTCGNANGSISVDAVTGGTSPYQYNINAGSFGPVNSFSGLNSAAAYTITLIDVNNCSLVLSAITLSDVAGPSAVATSQVNPACGNINGSITIDAVTGGTAPYQYSLNGGAFGIPSSFGSLSPATPYTISVQDANGCQFSLNPITLTDVTGPTSATTSQVNTTCGNANGSITVNTPVGGTAPYQYSLNGAIPGSFNVFSALSAGTYGIVITDANGCSLTLNPVIVTNTSGPTAINTTITNVACGNPTGGFIINDPLTVGGVGPYQYNINNLGMGTNTSISNLDMGTYPVVVQDANGCILNTSVTVGGTGSVDATFTATPSQGTVPLSVAFSNGSTSGLQYTWTFGNGGGATTYDAQTTYAATGTYTVTLVVSNGNPLCNATATTVISVNAEPTVVIPNIFSPNGDGINDILSVQANGYSELSIDIFNRWGQSIISYNALTGSWDGKDASEGTYFYLVKGKTIDGKEYEKHGVVMLVK